MLKLTTITDSLSDSYDSHLEEDKIKSTRMFCILGMVLFMSSSFVNRWSYPSILFEANMVRGLLMVTFGLIYWSTFRSFFMTYSSKIQHLLCFIPALCLMYVMSISSTTDTGHYINFGFLILIIMVLFAWTYIPLHEIVINAFIIIVVYSLSIYVGNNVETDIFLNELIPTLFVMFGAVSAGFIGRMINENHVRQAFLYRNSLKELAEKQNYFAHHDELTGLSNRRYSEELFQQDLSYAIKNNFSHFVMMFDLNYFKIINDERGHQVGDAVLKVIAQRLKNCTREKDHVCRIGGDEFAISLVVDKNQTNFIDNLQHKVKESITQPIKIGNQMLSVGISIGVASFPDDGSNYRVLLNIADERMYQDKFLQKQPDVQGSSLDSLGVKEAVDYNLKEISM